MSDHTDPNRLRDTLQPLLELLEAPPSPAPVTLAMGLATVIDAASIVLGVDSVGLMLVDRGGTPRVAGVADDRAAALERAQAETRQGPGIDSLTRDISITVADLAVAEEYADLWQLVSHTGVRAVLSSPVRAADEVIGNFNVLLQYPHRWSTAQVHANETYAHVVGLALNVTAQAVHADDTLTRLRTHLADSSDWPDWEDETSW